MENTLIQSQRLANFPNNIFVHNYQSCGDMNDDSIVNIVAEVLLVILILGLN